MTTRPSLYRLTLTPPGVWMSLQTSMEVVLEAFPSARRTMPVLSLATQKRLPMTAGSIAVRQQPSFQEALISVEMGKVKSQEEPRPTLLITRQATPSRRASKLGISFLVNTNTDG